MQNTNFRGLNVPEDGVECESFTIISIDSLLVYENKYYLHIYLDNVAYKTVDKKMRDYLMTIFLKLMAISFLILINRSYKCCTTIELT